VSEENRELKDKIDEVLESSFGYVSNGVFLIDTLAQEFYQSPEEETWSKLGDLFEGIQWIILTVTQIDGIQNSNRYINDPKAWGVYVQKVAELKDVLEEMEGALKSKDHVLVGDLLKYEVKTRFEGMNQALSSLVEGEGEDRDAH